MKLSIASSWCLLSLMLVLLSFSHKANAFVRQSPLIIQQNHHSPSSFGSSSLFYMLRHSDNNNDGPLLTSSFSTPTTKKMRKRDVFKRLTRVRLSNKRNDDSEEVSNSSDSTAAEDGEETKNNLLEGFQAYMDDLFKPLLDKIPPPVLSVMKAFFKKVGEIWNGVKVALFSFVAGSILTLAAILVPVYSSVEQLSEPVTLFETILSDLDAGYVDPVDTNRLFETGVSAMLRSLDPYTEFEAREEAQQLNEGIRGKYGGVGLVISGATPRDVERIEQKLPQKPKSGSKLLPKEAVDDNKQLEDGDMSSSSVSSADLENEDEEDEELGLSRKEERRLLEKARNRGIRVVSAFEGYAFDYGMRVGDKLRQVDDLEITSKTSVEDVRNVLRGEPGTMVTIQFDREGVEGTQEITMPRRIVQLRDVKLVTFVGDPKDRIGYISLTGFAANAGQEVRQAILALERAAEAHSPDGTGTLEGLVLDLRGNPGGLLTSAVDVASLLLPKDSDIVSARGRGFPGVTYRSRVDPILEPNTKLAVLVNRGTASAAEIVSGAVQDLDVGVIVGNDRTFGKGLVQNVEDLPFNTALKFTVAKYYTPSGRCIQGVNYSEGEDSVNGGRFKSSKVAERDRQNFYTKAGRIVKDGGGVEADYKVESPKASALEVTLLRSDVMGEFAAQWSRNNQLTNNFEVSDKMYREFQDFVEKKRQTGDIKLESIYLTPLQELKRALKESGYKGSEREVESLKANIVREIKNDFDKYKDDIKEDISNSILARYLPESMILERGLKTDKQVFAAVKLIQNDKNFNKVLAKGSSNEKIDNTGSLNIAATAEAEEKKMNSASMQVDF